MGRTPRDGRGRLRSGTLLEPLACGARWERSHRRGIREPAGSDHRKLIGVEGALVASTWERSHTVTSSHGRKRMSRKISRTIPISREVPIPIRDVSRISRSTQCGTHHRIGSRHQRSLPRRVEPRAHETRAGWPVASGSGQFSRRRSGFVRRSLRLLRGSVRSSSAMAPGSPRCGGHGARSGGTRRKRSVPWVRLTSGCAAHRTRNFARNAARVRGTDCVRLTT
jgi:hypothetical protein